PRLHHSRRPGAQGRRARRHRRRPRRPPRLSRRAVLALAIAGRVGLMAISQKLELRQGQALVMTPQLQQAIKLLQLSNLELAAFVEEEIERNPLLERDESGEPAVEAAQQNEATDEARSEDAAVAQDDFARS